MPHKAEQLLGCGRYSRFEELLNRCWAMEDRAYCLFGPGLRRHILEGFVREYLS